MARALVVAVAVLLGCGTVNGYPCDTEAKAQCDGADVAYCERTSLGGLKWKTYACRQGCDVLKQDCAWMDPKAGDACPASRGGIMTCTGDGEISTCTPAPDGGYTLRPAACPRCRAGASVNEALRPGPDGTLYCN